MKIIFTILFILTLLSTALAGVRVEAHTDHQHEEMSVDGHEVVAHEHAQKKTTNDSESTNDCPHFHIHCTSLCLGVLLSNGLDLRPVISFSKESIFSFQELIPQGYSRSFYRPPIS